MEKKNKKPVIGISGSITVMESGRFPGYRRTYVNEDYVTAVKMAGGIPLVLPMIDDETVIDDYMNVIDGLVLSGGHDVEPLRYKEQPLMRIGQTFPERDTFDIHLVERALDRDIPVLGICRGHQILNVALGGSLYQDLSYIPSCEIKHDQYSDPSLPTHEVDIEPNSRLHRIVGQTRVRTNSFHHLAIKELAKDLQVVALSDDGVIEAVEHKEKAHVMGVQWHPEMMAAKQDVYMSKLFHSLIEDCK